MRSFAELSSSGLLWLINRAAFHPRGYALAIHVDEETGDARGWSLRRSTSGPFVFTEAQDDDGFACAEATLIGADDARRLNFDQFEIYGTPSGTVNVECRECHTTKSLPFKAGPQTIADSTKIASEHQCSKSESAKE